MFSYQFNRDDSGFVNMEAMPHEHASLEFKSNYTKTFLKTVSAYANYGDGEIIFGIDDNGHVVGVEDSDSLCQRIENAVNDGVEPMPRYQLDQLTREGKNIVILKVLEGPDKPYCYNGKAYRRSHASTLQVDSSELRHLVLEGMNLSFEESLSSDQALSFSILDNKLKDKFDIENIDNRVYKTLELMDRKGNFNNAAAVLADDNTFPGVDIVRFGRNQDTFMERLTTDNSSAFKLYDDALNMFMRYYVYEVIDGTIRKTKSLVPENAFREALANALVHREWDIHARIRVSFFEDSIEVVSPGGLPRGVTEQDYLAGKLSVLRNPIIANVFARLGYIERFGTGIPRIIASYDQSVFKPHFSITASSIAITLPVVKQQYSLDANEAEILELLRENGELPRTSIQNQLSMDRNTVLRTLTRQSDAL